MARKNTDTFDINEKMGMHISLLKELKKEYGDLDFYRMCGTRKKGLRVSYRDKEILEVWSDTRIPEDNVGSICTKYLRNEDKKSAIPVKKFNYEVMGDDVFEKYAYHEDFSFKWSHWFQTYEDMKQEIVKCIEVYKNTL